MVEFRPHTLSYAIVTAGNIDSNGNYVGGSTTQSSPIKCRYENNAKAVEAVLPNGDGMMYRYAYQVYLDVNCRTFSYGEMITLYNQSGNKVAELPCKGFYRGQLNARLWL